MDKDSDGKKQLGRPRKALEDLSERSKRRRTEEEFRGIIDSVNVPSSHLEQNSSSPGSEVVADVEDKDFQDCTAENDSESLCDLSVDRMDSTNTETTVDFQGSFNTETIPESKDSVNDFVGSKESIGSDATEVGSDEVGDNFLWFDANDFTNLDCDICILCTCKDCNECSHSETGDCYHCNNCLCDSSCALNDDDSVECFSELIDDHISDNSNNDIVMSPESVKDAEMKSELAHIFINHNSSQELITDVLHFLQKYNLGNFPRCAKTLLQTPTSSIEIREVPPGQYWHNGVEKHITDFVKKSGSSVVEMSISSDGVPIFGSSPVSFWPLTCSFNNSPDVYVIGIYLGNEKPRDSNDYLQDFVEEVIPLCKNGLLVNEKKVSISVVSGIFDAPAKSFVLNTKGFNAYNGCSKCITEGDMLDRRMSFAQIDAPLRDDDSFAHPENDDYHKGPTILNKIPNFGCVTSVPLDYMHLLLLGLMRKLIYFWIAGPLPRRLSAQNVTKISELFEDLTKWVPMEFARKPRSWKFVKRFKATEFRQILLYTGPVVFYKILPQHVYENFLVFHVFTTIFVNPSFCRIYIDYAKELCVYFVKTFAVLYGEPYVSHNVHSVIHIHLDVRKFGHLDLFSAFKFENYYQLLKKLVRKGEKPLVQLVRRFLEMEKLGCSTSSKSQNFVSNDSKTFHLSRFHNSGPLISGCMNPQYSMCTLQDGFKINLTDANNCCIVNEKVVLVDNFALNQKGDSVLIGREFLTVEDVFSTPLLPSSTFGIFYVQNLSEQKVWLACEITRKCFQMPFKNGYAVFSLHHSEKL